MRCINGDHRHDQYRLLHGEASAEAGSLTVAKGLPGVLKHVFGMIEVEACRPEYVRLVPNLGIAVKHRQKDEQDVIRGQPVSACEGRILNRMYRKTWSRGPKPQGLHQHLFDDFIPDLIYVASHGKKLRIIRLHV